MLIKTENALPSSIDCPETTHHWAFTNPRKFTSGVHPAKEHPVVKQTRDLTNFVLR